MAYLRAFISAMAISMMIIPLLARVAPKLGMIDHPDRRKVHAIPVPRVGGVGIVIGALAPILLWMPLDHEVQTYLFGAAVLLIFGVWDDIRELGHYAKFTGQIIAVLPFVYYGDVYITHLPLINAEVIPAYLLKAFTVFALLGMINAINHSDGLDGLAGGMSMLSLICMGYLAYMAGGYYLIAIAMAALGGVFGFLRYNNHPARVFMGDGGSQFLGFTLGVLAILLTHDVNPALSAALPLLILGLPIIDILAVLAQRIYHGMNWFRATKNHIHHRLLAIGFDHHESVVIIYSIQTFFVASAVIFPYEKDAFVLSLYLGVCALIFIFLTIAEWMRWNPHRNAEQSVISKAIAVVTGYRWTTTLPVKVVGTLVATLFIVVAIAAVEVPRDFGIGAFIMACLLLIALSVDNRYMLLLRQAVFYVAAAFVTYLEATQFVVNSPWLNVVEMSYFILLALAIGFSIRYGRQDGFKTTPMDYLVVIFTIVAGALLHAQPQLAEFGGTVIKLIIVFYGCELIIGNLRSRRNALDFSVLGALAVIAARGLM